MIDTDWGLCFGRDRRARSVRLRLPGVQRRGVCRRGHPRADSGRRVRVVRLDSRDGRIRPAPAQVVTRSAVPRFADGDGSFCRWPRSFFGREPPPRFLGLREDSPRTRLHHRAVSSTTELKASSPSLASLVGTPSPTVPNYTLEISREYSIYSSIQLGQLKIKSKSTRSIRETQPVCHVEKPLRVRSGAPLHKMGGRRKTQYEQSSTPAQFRR